MRREWDAEELAEFERDRRARRGEGCRCGGDMPGRCPGLANCPLCREKDEDDDDDHGG